MNPIIKFVNAIKEDNTTNNVSEYFSLLSEQIQSPKEYFDAVVALLRTWYSVHATKNDTYRMSVDMKIASIASNCWTNVDVFEMVEDAFHTNH